MSELWDEDYTTGHNPPIIEIIGDIIKGLFNLIFKSAFTFLWLFALVISAVVYSCNYIQPPPPPPSESTQFFVGSHPLLSLNQFMKLSEKQTSSGMFFICIGSYSSTSNKSEEKTVSFSWLNNQKQYVISELPMNKVRFQMDSTVKVPYCKFKWITGYGAPIFNEATWSENVSYVLFVIRPEQVYNKDVKLDLK